MSKILIAGNFRLVRDMRMRQVPLRCAWRDLLNDVIGVILCPQNYSNLPVTWRKFCHNDITYPRQCKFAKKLFAVRESFRVMAPKSKAKRKATQASKVALEVRKKQRQSLDSTESIPAGVASTSSAAVVGEVLTSISTLSWRARHNTSHDWGACAPRCYRNAYNFLCG